MDKATFTELFREMRKDLQDNDCSDWAKLLASGQSTTASCRGRTAARRLRKLHVAGHDDARAARHGALPLRAEARHDLMAQKSAGERSWTRANSSASPAGRVWLCLSRRNVFT